MTTVRVPIRSFLSIPEVARLRGVTRVAVLYDVRSGKLRASRVPGVRTWLVHVADARRYLETRVRARRAA